MASYPASIVSLTNPASGDYEDVVPHATQHANANDEIEAIETELGTTPSGAWTDVATRLDVTIQPVWNIEELGAVAGSSAAGAANAGVIQYAIGLAAGGGTVYIPPGTFYVDGTAATDLITISPTHNGVNIVGEDSSVSIIHDLRSSGSTFAVKGTSASVRAKYHTFRDFQVIGDSGGTNTRKAFDFKWAGHVTMRRVQFWSTAHAIYGHDWWDSLVDDCRFDQCSTRDGSNLGAVYLLAQSSDTSDCNSLRFTNNTWEQCWERDVTLYSNGRDVNKIRFFNNKFECGGSGFLKGDRIVITGGDSISFLDNDFTLGEWYTAYTTPHFAINATNARSLKIIGNRFEGAPVSSGPTVDGFVAITDSGGTSDAIVIVGNEFQASTNQTGIVALQYSLGATPGDVVDIANVWGYVASGTPAVRSNYPWVRRWTPTIDGSVSDPNLGSTAVTVGEYRLTHEKRCQGNAFLKWSGSGKTAGSGVYSIPPPVTADLTFQTDVIDADGFPTSTLVGKATMVAAGGLLVGSHVIGNLHLNASGQFVIVPELGGQVTYAYAASDGPWAWGTDNDAIHIEFDYRVSD